jgi:hypothetical protein
LVEDVHVVHTARRDDDAGGIDVPQGQQGVQFDGGGSGGGSSRSTPRDPSG